MSKQIFVYILECCDKSYYTGVTNDLKKRIRDHERGYMKTCYTFKRRPLKLVYYKEFGGAFKAIQFEKQVKGWTRAKKEALIQGNILRLVALSNHNKIKK